jgi:hypothetical protein
MNVIHSVASCAHLVHPTVDIVPRQTIRLPHDILPVSTSLPVGFGAPMFLYIVQVHTCISYCDIR